MTRCMRCKITYSARALQTVASLEVGINQQRIFLLSPWLFINRVFLLYLWWSTRYRVNCKNKQFNWPALLESICAFGNLTYSVISISNDAPCSLRTVDCRNERGWIYFYVPERVIYTLFCLVFSSLKETNVGDVINEKKNLSNVGFVG